MSAGPTSSADAPDPVDDLLAATAVSPDAHVPGRLDADLPVDWNSPVGIHGGVFVATAIRAMGTQVTDPGFIPRTVHASFLSRPASGSLVLDTDVARRGGLTTHTRVAARTRGADEQALEAWCLWTRPIDLPVGWTDATPPDVAGPDELESRTIGPSSAGLTGMVLEPRLFARIEVRPALGLPHWVEGWAPEAPARFACWYRFRTEPLGPDGMVDPAALAVLADLPGGAIWARLGPDDPFLALLSLELTLHVLEPARGGWFLVDTRARHLADGYVVTECDLWNDGRLVATSNQMMLARPFGPPG